MDLVVNANGLDQIIAALRAEGRTVFGPTVRDGAIAHREIDGVDDLPGGWTDAQEPGRSRLVPTNDDRRFAFSAPSESWKRFLHPQRTLMIRSRRGSDGAISIEEPENHSAPVAFFGVRSCDLAGIAVLDRVFLEDAYPDPGYASRREDVFIVAAACATPASTCFCASMNTGPAPTGSFDLSIAELTTDDGIEYLVTTGSPAGEAVLGAILGRRAAQPEHDRAAAQTSQAIDAMTRHIEAGDLARAAIDPDHPRWANVASRCLACGNCTMVCPTCFCSSVEDTTSLDRTETDRTRVWDSCFTLDFTHLHGGSTRTSTASRYRQWLLHKLATWEEQFDTSGCVGCGRCITWCPVGIDLTEEIAALSAQQLEVST